MSLIRIDGWRSGVRFDAAHMIPHHPKCGRLHGHTYAIHIDVHGTPGETGFILDFGLVKKAIKQIADELDHHVLIQAKSPHFTPRRDEAGVSFEVEGKRYQFPFPDAILLDVEHTTAEHLAEFVADEVKRRVQFPPNVSRFDVGVDESYGKGAWTTRVLTP